MYKFYDEVSKMLDELMDSEETLEDASKNFYRRNCLKFFDEYMSLPENDSKPINAITYYDINSYLDNNTNKVNIYNSLKRFFEYTYKLGKTPDIISQVNKPIVKKKKPKIIKEEDYLLLKKFITDKDNNLSERLILGLFLSTGLSRQYIADMRNSQFVFENGVYKLSVIKKKGKNPKEFILPIKLELQLIINEYMLQTGVGEKIINMDENSLSSYVSMLAEKITGTRYIPTNFSNTFIVKALKEGNRVWEVSRLVLESVGNVEKLIKEDNESLFLRQTMILNGF